MGEERRRVVLEQRARAPTQLGRLTTGMDQAGEEAQELHLLLVPRGEVRVPAGALYGPQTQRAVDNFPIGGPRFPRSFLRALGLIKAANKRRARLYQ